MMQHIHDENSSLNMSLSTPLKTPGHHRSKSATPFARTPGTKGKTMTGGTPGRRALGDISNKKSDRSFMTPGKAGINIMGSVQKKSLFPVPSPAPKSHLKPSAHNRSKSVSFLTSTPVPSTRGPSTPGARVKSSLKFKVNTPKSGGVPDIELSAGRTGGDDVYCGVDKVRGEMRDVMECVNAGVKTPTLKKEMESMNVDDMGGLTGGDEVEESWDMGGEEFVDEGGFGDMDMDLGMEF